MEGFRTLRLGAVTHTSWLCRDTQNGVNRRCYGEKDARYYTMLNRIQEQRCGRQLDVTSMANDCSIVKPSVA